MMAPGRIAPASLAAWIDSQPLFLDEGQLRGLETRKQEEAEFHDQDRAPQRSGPARAAPNRRFYAAFSPVRSYVHRWIESTVSGKTFLDYASGSGAMAIAGAHAGAGLAVGIDISAVSVKKSAAAAEASGLGSSVRFLQRDCEATGLPANSFDACLCQGMLHHLDLGKAFPELHRIMAPRGRILCVEALGYNPIIQWYRNRTPELRTVWERDHILTLRDVRLAQRWFRVENLRFHLIAAPLGVFVPVAVRAGAIRLGHAIDGLLTRIPLVQRWSWIFTFELVKPEATEPAATSGAELRGSDMDAP